MYLYSCTQVIVCGRLRLFGAALPSVLAVRSRSRARDGGRRRRGRPERGDGQRGGQRGGGGRRGGDLWK